jgi:ABC-2 type transport system permease protein
MRFKTLLTYEWITLFRSRWIQLLALLLLVLCWFAAGNGQQKVQKRMADIAQVEATTNAAYARAILLLDSLENGLKVSAPASQIPNTPQVAGNNYPRVASMPASAYGLIATGQSDLYTHYIQPNIRGEDFALNFTELASPVQLLFGAFDLSFVIVYLLPLIVIAFTYDLLSGERELGTLRLLAAQPLTIHGWLSQKAVLRFLLFMAIVAIALILALAGNGLNIIGHASGFGRLILITFAYVLFWFLLAFLVNLQGRSSAYHAVYLLAAWVVLVLLIPSIINQLSNNLYPTPSRAALIHEMRMVKKEAESKQDEILDSYLRDHPEYGSGSAAEAGNFWTRYFASQALVETEMAPLLEQFDQQLSRQQNWINRWRFASPAILVQDGLNELAQTSDRHYREFRIQAIDFAAQWRAFFIPMVFKEEKVSTATFELFPQFDYQPERVSPFFFSNTLALLGYGLVLVALSLRRFSGSSREKIISGT